MLAGLLIAAVVLGALACPLMMWLGRRGIGPGCALMGCSPQRSVETLESLRARERELAERIAQLEQPARADAPASAKRI